MSVEGYSTGTRIIVGARRRIGLQRCLQPTQPQPPTDARWKNLRQQTQTLIPIGVLLPERLGGEKAAVKPVDAKQTIFASDGG
ncbi:MAG: hypothetical protein KZQ92_02035 [Candidatus Thiodiazotropha sp. (ex Lucinoma borealis)]|nr:hypothetical protein [Candidatus Thiodiazotropha sp. (ex Lucinoma borealis)]